MKINLTSTVLGFALAGFTGVAVATAAERPPGMAWIPGGEFAMGTDDHRPRVPYTAHVGSV